MFSNRVCKPVCCLDSTRELHTNLQGDKMSKRKEHKYEKLLQTIVELADSGYTIPTIAKELCIDSKSLDYFMRTRGIKINKSFERLGDSFNQILVEEYNSGLSLKQLADKYSCSKTTIKRKLMESGCNTRTSYDGQKLTGVGTNSTCFTNFEEDEAAAYFYGWLLTDGCLTNDYITISLKSSDKYILESLKFYCGSKNNIKQKNIYLKSNNKTYESYCFSVADKYLIDRLRQQGLSERKSCIESLPKFNYVDGRTSAVFWRGVIEGDGHVSLGRTSPEISLVGSEELTTGFIRFAENSCNARFGKSTKSYKKDNPKFKTVVYTGDDCRKIVRKLWSAGTIFLERKKVIAEQIMQQELTGIIKQ